jgi:hypothetical protein
MCQACDEGRMAPCSGVLSLLKEICQRRLLLCPGQQCLRTIKNQLPKLYIITLADKNHNYRHLEKGMKPPFERMN